MKKPIITLLSLFLIIGSFLTSVSAETKNDILDLSQEIAEEYIATMGEGFEITGATPLLDGTEERKGYLFHLSDDNDRPGYVIVYAYDGTLRVTESSFETDIDVEENDTVFYNGLFGYLVERNNKLVDYRTDEEVSRNVLNEFPDISLTDTVLSRQNRVETRSITPNYLYHLASTVTAIDQHSASSNGNYKCMQTSAAMLIQYYKEHWTGYSSIASVTGGSLIDALSSYIPLSGTYTTLANLKTGLANYISAKGFTPSVVSNQCDLYNDTLPYDFPDTMAVELTNNKPMIIIIGSECVFTSGTSPLGSGSASMHAMLVNSVIYLSAYSNYYIGVVDPWDATAKQILWDPYNSASREYFAVYSVVRVTLATVN